MTIPKGKINIVFQPTIIFEIDRFASMSCSIQGCESMRCIFFPEWCKNIYTQLWRHERRLIPTLVGYFDCIHTNRINVWYIYLYYLVDLYGKCRYIYIYPPYIDPLGYENTCYSYINKCSSPGAKMWRNSCLRLDMQHNALLAHTILLKTS